MADTQTLRAYLRLTLADGVGAVTFRKLVEAFGGAGRVPVDSPKELMRVDGVGDVTATAIATVTAQDVDAELELAGKFGATFITLEDEGYPRGLRKLYDAPPLLYVRGRMEEADAIALGVVGSRHCTHYGMEQAERFGQLLGRAGFTVISGGARGIDAAAHRGALAAGGRTIAVMGCGLCKFYPPENQKLFEQIINEGRGAVISELPMRTAVLGGNFPTRNRIISGLSLGVLVVEAARRSGSLITAREALDQGKTVFAVPGRVDSLLSQGANELIRSGAVLVQDLDDILEHLGEVGAKMAVEDKPVEAAVQVALNETERKLVAALGGGPMGLDELVRHTGVDTGKAASAMTMLVLKGMVSQQPGNVFARNSRGLTT
ncbi:MAG: DNA-processing protein DprA [Phycisphaerae bacterium]